MGNIGTENSGIRRRIMEYGKEITMMPSWQIVVIQLSGALSQPSSRDAVLNIWPATGAEPPGPATVAKEQEAQGGEQRLLFCPQPPPSLTPVIPLEDHEGWDRRIPPREKKWIRLNQP